MRPQLKNLEDQTIVITGASSGGGRATAHAFAWRGANLVLTARAAALALGLVGAVAAGAMLAARPADGRHSSHGSRNWRSERGHRPHTAARSRVGRTPELAPGVPMPPGVA
jgi:NAD(P)-dependent dehydrogenase (short-subunit alcohol dehydrogenase family)